MAKYSNKAQKIVKEVMGKFERGELESGQSHKRVTNHKQAIAIALSEARKSGARMPPYKKK